jgi:hypothetical protein
MPTKPLFELAVPWRLPPLSNPRGSARVRPRLSPRHATGDRGGLTYGVIRANESAVKHDDRILSTS